MSGVHDSPFPEFNSLFNSKVVSIVAMCGASQRRFEGQDKTKVYQVLL